MNYRIFLLAIICISCGRTENKNIDQKIFYYENGKVKAIKNYNDTLLNGMNVWYYPNGRVEQIATYINGEAEGHAYIFYESGALKSRRLYKNGVQVGYGENYFDHSIGLINLIEVHDEKGKLQYFKELDINGKIVRDSGYLK